MSKSSIIPSPITSGTSTFLFDIPKNQIVEAYLKETGIDVNYLFEGNAKISLYLCNETGYRFFYPFNIDGDSPFYEKLESISWYYANWKWDYEVAKSYIKDESRVIDIGCGEAKFLDYLIHKKQCDCEGLELNTRAMEIAKSKGIKVSNELIQNYASSNDSQFDVVTFFQVLEHISDVHDFLQSAIKITKPNGLLILTVPNNDPYYLTYDKYHFLNLPPHHMGWWNEFSLLKIAEFYNLKIIEIKKQPLEHYSAFAYAFLTEKWKLPRRVALLLKPIFKILVYLFKSRINGASIMAVLQKQ